MTDKTLRYTQNGCGMIETFRVENGDRVPAGDWVKASDYDEIRSQLIEANLKVAGLILKTARTSDAYLTEKAALANEGEEAAVEHGKVTEHLLKVLIGAAQYAVNRLDADNDQPQVSGDLAVAIAYTRDRLAPQSSEASLSGLKFCCARDEQNCDIIAKQRNVVNSILAGAHPMEAWNRIIQDGKFHNAPMYAIGKWSSVPREIDREHHRPVLEVWNACMAEHESLEMTWPKLVLAIAGGQS